ncbi:MAG TPA: PP2C family protein-serine/threonine phosphatase [Vicinamibacteria bacterium]|nr:PP2C family protein-serine/threonine phosphatase [Vicinamibacteria bacterium]
MKAGLGDLRSRLDAFTARFAEHAHRPGEAPPRAGRVPDTDDYWRSVQDLFTRDVTGQGVRDLVGYETHDAWRYFSREIDFARLRALPWHKRYPLAAWKIFLAVAFRLSPARRLLFAVAVPLLALGWFRYLLSGTAGAWFTAPAFAWVLFAATLLFALLVLELRDKLVLKGDLEIARQIQFGLLPFEPYERDGVTVHAAMRPANTVGGDYFDIIELGEGRLGIAVADVAGKGMPAALLMALLQGSLRTLITAGFRGAELVGKLNAHLHANIPANRLVTLFYCELEPETGRLGYVNAGHNAPFLLRPGGLARLPATDVALGVLPDARFQEAETALAPGDRLFVYTDGVSEAFDARDCEYGEARLQALLEGHRHLADPELLKKVQADVLVHCGAAKPHDDMTLLVLARRPAA